jgi:tellurium resistance protein TerZ
LEIDYSFQKALPTKATFGLAWDVTRGVNIDLDASAICLDSSFNLVDIVSYSKLRSNDNSIIHHGDEREGDEVGDDEKIDIYFDRVSSNISYIAFVINSFSGQELDDVSKASCHLFDSMTKVDIARYCLSNNKAVDGYTGLVMACLYRENDDWNMRIISEAAHGKVARDLVDEFQNFLRTNPPPPPSIVPEPDVVVNAMPEDVEIIVEPIEFGMPVVPDQGTKPVVPVTNQPFVPP